MQEISPLEYQTLADEEPAPVLLDVREAWELELARVEHAVHIPMGQIPDRLTELAGDRTIVVMCHHGSRSATVGQFLLRNGFTQVLNLTGGIDAWSRDVDPNVPSY